MGQAITTTQFFLYGKKHFTATGYKQHVKSYYPNGQAPASATSSTDDAGSTCSLLKGQTIAVTGANSGIGYQIALYAAHKGAHVILVCRNPDKAQDARASIVSQAQCSETNLSIVLCDVSQLAQVQRAARELRGVDTLVCNAGVLLSNLQVSSEEKYEATFASHLLSTYLFYELLKDHSLKKHIIVTSGGMYNFKLPTWDVLTSYTRCENDKQPKSFTFDGQNAYAYAKRGQVLLAEQLSHASSSTTTTTKTSNPPVVVTVHPGWTATPAVQDAYGDQSKYLQPMRTPWQGAEGICYLLSCEQNNLEPGALYLDRKVQTKHLAGPFLTEGKFTKNTPTEIATYMQHMKEAVQPYLL